MTDYKGKVIDSCSDCGKRGPMWSGMPYRCKGCSDKMSKSNNIFEKAWFSINKEASCCDRPRFIERKDGSMRCRTCQKSKISKGSKPDYLDFDEDGDKKEPMKDALRSKKVKKGMGFEKAWGIVKGSPTFPVANCATSNCEDNSAEKDWSYCNKNGCVSCSGGCDNVNCKKCNDLKADKW